MSLCDSCIFCKIVKGIIPCHRLLETQHALAFLDINPISRGHLVVIPKYHGTRLQEIPEEYAVGCMSALHHIARTAFNDSDYNVLQNNGPLAHQEVPHVHFHLIPKHTESDDSGLIIGWPIQKDLSERSILASLADELRTKIDSIN